MALTDKLTSVADAIRAKTGDTASLTLDQMPTAIAGIETGGSAGGGSVKTCNLTVSIAFASSIKVSYSKLVDGELVIEDTANIPINYGTYTIPDVACGSNVHIKTIGYPISFSWYGDSDYVSAISIGGLKPTDFLIQVYDNASSNESIYMYDDD